MDVQMFGVSGSSSNCKCFTLFSEGLTTKRSLSYNSGAKPMKELIVTHSIFTSSFPQGLHKKAGGKIKFGHYVHKISGSLMLSFDTSADQTPAIGLTHHLSLNICFS